MSEVTLTAPNISCDHCKRTIESELVELTGVQSVAVEPPAKSIHVVYDGAVVDEPAIRERLDEIGFPVGG